MPSISGKSGRVEFLRTFTGRKKIFLLLVHGLSRPSLRISRRSMFLLGAIHGFSGEGPLELVIVLDFTLA
jgi:hypothetical protein